MSKYIPVSAPYHKIWNDNYPKDMIIEGDGYIIHHKDGNHNNNVLNNLQKMTAGAHSILHQKGKPKSKVHKLKLARSHMGMKASEETKLKMSMSRKGKNNPNYGMDFSGRNNPHFGFKHSLQVRLKMKIAAKKNNARRKRNAKGQFVANNS